MYAGTLLILIAEIILFWIILTAIQYPLRKEVHRFVRTAVFIVKVFMIPVMALLQIAIESPLPYRIGSALTALYIALIGDVAASVIEYIIRRIRSRKNKLHCIILWAPPRRFFGPPGMILS